MHGIFLVELYKYVNTVLGERMWKEVLQQLGQGPKVYVASVDYPDQEIVMIMSAISKLTDIPIPSVLEDFGEFLASDLLSVYGTLVSADWKTLDVLERTGGFIHGEIHRMNPQTKPPELNCSRLNENELVMSYESPRRMCALVKGVAKGFAKHFDEQIEVREDQCMLRGSASCRIWIKRLKTLGVQEAAMTGPREGSNEPSEV